MLSILIPVYNYPCFPLVKELAVQCEEAGIVFEILVMDDASQHYLEENRNIKQLPGCRFLESTVNQGSGKSRNELSRMAMFSWLLMLDCDLEILDGQFIHRYLNQLGTADVLVGSVVYQLKKPSKANLLRWVYGRKRESLTTEKRNRNPWKSMSTPNLLIGKAVMEQVPFNEKVEGYGHEDTLWGYALHSKHVRVKYINNPILHNGLDTSEVFLKKSLVAVQKYFTPTFQSNKVLLKQIKIFAVYNQLQRFKVDKLVGFLYQLTEPMLKRNLLGASPMLVIFDFYRLGYLCTLKKNESI